MKYKYKLVENTGGEDTPIGGGSKGIPKSSIDIVLTPSSDTTVKDIEDNIMYHDMKHSNSRTYFDEVKIRKLFKIKNI